MSMELFQLLVMGSSWDNAFKNHSRSIGYMYATNMGVAAGTYKPTAYPAGCTNCLTSRDYTFHLVNGVKLYGGFCRY